MDYTVGASDTLERIAARNDCTPSELMKFNHLHSRMIFPGQKIRIPPLPPEVPMPEVHKNITTFIPQNNPPMEVKRENVELQKRTPDSMFLPPKKQNLELSISNGIPTESDNIPAAPGTAIRTSPTEAELDEECFQKFLKLRVKHFTDGEGTVSGTLLVTPNCLMFDPDVTHPLVRENGSDPYGMVAPLEQIVSAALYKDVSAMTGEEPAEPYMPTLDRNRSKSETVKGREGGAKDNSADVRHSLPPDLDVSFGIGPSEPENESAEDKNGQGSPRLLPCIEEEELAHIGEGPGEQTVQRRHMSDSETGFGYRSQMALSLPDVEKKIVRSCPSLDEEESRSQRNNEKVSHTKSVPMGSGSPFTSKKLAGLRRSLKDRASTISGTLTSGVEKVSSGAQNVAGAAKSGAQAAAGAVTHSVEKVSTGAQNVAVVVQSGAQNVAAGLASGTKAAAGSLTSGAKAAAGAVVRAPQNIVNMSSGLFDPTLEYGVLDIQDTWFADDSASSLRRKQSMAKLQVLKAKAAQYREEASRSRFACATDMAEKPELFKTIEELLPAVTASSPELPYYFCVRLVRKRRKKRRRVGSESMYSALTEEPLFGNRKKAEFWFTIPRDKADLLYGFMLQWKVGAQVNEESVDEAGFLILDNEEEEDLQGEKPSTPLVSSYLNMEWEIVTVEEVRRRLDLDLSPQDLPLPEGSLASKMLEESKIRQILEVLPARAEGYPWVLIYGSDVHGFSLQTLYRKMVEWGEDMSPTLLVIKDIEGWIFGAVVSGPIRKSEHFYGTGDSCFLYTFHPENELRTYSWTGENQFFVQASGDSLAVGAGQGTFGLWLDQDLNHGRTVKCPTFDNPPLTQHEDFILAQVEAWGFSMGF